MTLNTLYLLIFVVLPVVLFLSAGWLLGASAMILGGIAAMTLLALLVAILGGPRTPRQTLR